MPRLIVPGIQEFLKEYFGMKIRPSQEGHGVTLIGTFEFCARSEKSEEITDSYNLQINIPPSFPKDIPSVQEVDGKIPRNGEYHVNSDGTLCLGSRIRLLLQISLNPTISGFAEKCLVPYLYAVSHKIKFGGQFLFSELPHGTSGELLDYVGLFGLKEPDQARAALQLLAMKKRIANKYPCPCGCGQRLGKCKFNDTIKNFRELADKSWFQSLIGKSGSS